MTGAISQKPEKGLLQAQGLSQSIHAAGATNLWHAKVTWKIFRDRVSNNSIGNTGSELIKEGIVTEVAKRCGVALSDLTELADNTL